MISETELRDMQARADAASGDTWHPGEENGSPVVIVAADRERSVLTLRRDLAPASAADVAFVAHARDDLARLITALVGGAELTATEWATIAARSDSASPGPWTPFLTDDGGIGGSNVIWVSDDDDQPDLYIWIDSEPAPNGDYEFVAHVREDIPRLLAELSSSQP